MKTTYKNPMLTRAWYRVDTDLVEHLKIESLDDLAIWLLGEIAFNF